MKKIFNYLLMIMLLIPCIVKAEVLSGTLTASVTIDKFDEYITERDNVEDLTGSALDTLVKNKFMSLFTDPDVTSSITNILDCTLDETNGYIRGHVAYANDNKKAFELDLVPVLKLPIPEDRMLSNGYQYDFLAIIVKNYFDISNSVTPGYLVSNSRYAFGKDIVLQIGKHGYAVVKTDTSITNFTESVTVVNESQTIDKYKAFGLIQYAYTKSLENGIPFDKSVNYIDELNNSEEAIMNVFNMQISSNVGSDNMPYAYGYVTGEPYEFVVAVYNKLKTEHKMYLYKFIFIKDNSPILVADESINDFSTLKDYFDCELESIGALNTARKSFNNSDFANVKGYVGDIQYYAYNTKGEILFDKPIYTEHYVLDVKYNKISNLTTVMEKDTTQSVINLTNDFGYAMDFEIPSDAQNYLEYTNSVLTVKNTIPNGGKKIKLVFHQEIESSSKTTSGLLEDDYVWVTMRDINDDYSKTLYGTLETESIISTISDYTVSVIDMTSPISYYSAVNYDNTESITFDTAYKNIVGKILYHKGESDYNVYDNMDFVDDYGYQVHYAKNELNGTVDYIPYSYSNFQEGTDFYDPSTNTINVLFKIRTLVKDGNKSKLVISPKIVKFKLLDDEIDTIKNDVDTKLDDLYKNGFTISTVAEYVGNTFEGKFKTDINSRLNNYFLYNSINLNSYNYNIGFITYNYDSTKSNSKYGTFRLYFEDRTNPNLNFVTKPINVNYDLDTTVVIYDNDTQEEIIDDIHASAGDTYFDIEKADGENEYKFIYYGNVSLTTKITKDPAFRVKQIVDEIAVGETVSILDFVKIANDTTKSIINTDTVKDTTYSVVTDDNISGKASSEELEDKLVAHYTFELEGGIPIDVVINYVVLAEGNIDVPIQTVGTTFTQLKDALNGKNIKLFEKDGTTVANGKLKTGQIIKYGSKSYDVIVKGDPSGDGAIDFMDYVKVYNHIDKKTHPESTKSLLESVYFTAGDYDASGDIDFMDYVKIYNYINKK